MSHCTKRYRSEEMSPQLSQLRLTEDQAPWVGSQTHVSDVTLFAHHFIGACLLPWLSSTRLIENWQFLRRACQRQVGSWWSRSECTPASAPPSAKLKFARVLSMLSGLPCAQLAMDRIENDDDVSQSTQLSQQIRLVHEGIIHSSKWFWSPCIHHHEQDLKETCGRTAVLQGLFLVKRLVWERQEENMWEQQQWRPDFLPERLESSQELELELVLRQGNQSSLSGGLCVNILSKGRQKNVVSGQHPKHYINKTIQMLMILKILIHSTD